MARKKCLPLDLEPGAAKMMEFPLNRRFSIREIAEFAGVTRYAARRLIMRMTKVLPSCPEGVQLEMVRGHWMFVEGAE